MPDLLAEHVLQSVLDAQPVDVADIRAAIAGLHTPDHASGPESARNAVLEQIALVAAKVVAADDVYNRALLDDSVYDNIDAIWDGINALRPLLAELANG